MTSIASTKNMTDAEKRAALAKLLQKQASSYPLTHGQMAMWFHQQLNPQSSAYNIPLCFVLNGKIEDLSLVERSLEYVVKKHDALRTRFKFDGEEPSQYICQDTKVVVPFRDFQQQAKDDWQQAILLDSVQQANKPFDLERDTLFRTELLKLSEDRFVIQFTVHHIVFDGWSVGVLLRDFAAAFVAHYDGIEPPKIAPMASYKTFVNAQRKSLQGRSFETKLSYWKKRLTGCSEAIDLPLDFPRPEKQTFAGKVYIEAIEAKLTEQLTAFSRQHNCTLFSLLQANIYLFFSKLSGQNDITLGVSQANRDEAAFRDIIGLCSEVVPMRCVVDYEQTFLHFVQQVQQQTLSDLEHGGMPLTKILESLDLQRDPARNQLFQVGFDFQNTPWPKALGELVYLLTGDAQSSKLDLNFNISKDVDSMLVIVEYNTDLFEQASVEHFTSLFLRILQASVEQSDRQLKSLSFLCEQEEYKLQQAALGQPLVDDLAPSVLHRIAHWAECQGDSLALSDMDSQINYRELYHSVMVLADVLRQKGLEGEFAVAVDMPRCPRQIIAMLAIMAVGARYLPLDHNAPDHYKSEILEDAGCRYLVRLDDREICHQVTTINVSRMNLQDVSRVSHFALSPGQGAYLIYTSGSTGKPKGVMVSHDNLRVYCEAARISYDVTNQDKVLQFANVCFDTSVEEIFPAFWSGAELFLRTPDLHERLLDYWPFCEANQITMVNFPTTYWHNLMDELVVSPDIPALSKMKMAVVGGEAVKLEKVSLWQQLMPGHIRLLNTYGPSETTVAVTARELHNLSELTNGTGIASVGNPLPFCNVAIVDEFGNLLPRGIFGELLIFGPTVCDGYYNNPQLNHERFGQCELLASDSHRYFKSGDVGKFGLNGEIEFKGRRDNQVKNRGYRVELSHIESLVSELPQINRAIAVQMTQGQATRIVAFAIPEDTQSPDSLQLISTLQDAYADYLVPDHIEFVEDFPLTASGKIDRVKLSRRQISTHHHQEVQAPNSQTERQLVEVCSELLGVNGFGLEANFFALGGHSLLLAKLIARLKKHFDIRLPVKVVYEAKNLADLAAAIDHHQADDKPIKIAALPKLQRREQVNRFAASSTQRRLWFLNQLDPESTAYLIPKSFHITGELNVGALESAMNQLVRRHEALRTRLISVDGQPMQEVHQHLEIEMKKISLQHLGEEEQHHQIENYTLAECATPLNIASLPVFRCTLIRLNDQHFVFLLTIHHILVDGVSMAILLDDLGQLYERCLAQADFLADAAPVQFADYAHWQLNRQKDSQYQQSLNFWKEYLGDGQPGLSLPYDRAPGASQTHIAANVQQRIDQPIKTGLSKILPQVGGSFYTLTLSVFNLCMLHYTGQNDLMVGTVVDGRDHPDAQDCVGFFANTLLLRSQIDPADSLQALLNDSIQSVTRVQEHKHVPFDEVINHLGWSSERSQGVLDVLFLYEKRELESHQGNGISFNAAPLVYNQAKVPLSLSIHEYADHLAINWEYSVDLFDQKTIESMAQHFRFLLQHIAQQPVLTCPLVQLPLSPVQQRDLPVDTGCFVDSERSVSSELHQAFAQFSQQKALIVGDQVYTYQQLASRVQALSEYLSSFGIKPGDSVGLCLKRDADLVVAMLSLLASHITYVPIDPDNPASRINHLLQQTECKKVLCHAQTLAAIPAELQNKVLLLDDETIQWQLSSDVVHKGVPAPHRISHVIMTSGSTGQPKIVQISHANVVALIDWARQAYPNLAQEIVLAGTPITFDLSVFEIVVTLSCGGCVELVDSVLSLVDTPSQATLINTVPSAATTLLENRAIGDSVSTLNLAGEPLPPSLVKEIFATTAASEVNNLYGPSEDTTYSTHYRMTPGFDGQVTIGQAIDGSFAVLCNQWGIPVPAGVSGEIYLGGRGVSYGYLNQPQLTTNSFVRMDHLFPGQTLYKTGDHARFDENGQLHYLGRQDHQVKLRGFRIELDEIRFALLSMEQIKEAAVLVDGENLCAFVAPQQVDSETVSEALSKLLPSYMLPQRIISLDTLPLNHHGKLDRQGLLTQLGEAEQSPGEQLAGNVQTELAQLWQKVLPELNEPLVQQSNFYHLGGHSLLLVRLFYLIKQHFDIELRLIDLMQALTLKAQGELIAQQHNPVEQELEVLEW